MDNAVPMTVQALNPFHQAVWSVGDFATADQYSNFVWVVNDSNGKNLIRSEG